MPDRPDAVLTLIRAVRPDDGLNAQLGLTERSFGPISSAGRDQRRQPLADGVAQGRVLGAFDRSRPVGAVAIVCAARRGLPVATHTPSEVKAAVTGNGRAGKEQVTTMVTKLLRISDPPRPPDAADALALAICHVWRGGGSRTPRSPRTPISTGLRPVAATIGGSA